jgi:glycerol-3-phosphate acyltransferase PlsY
MEEYLIITAAFLAAYLIGSTPTAVWLGEAYFGIDVRKYGSGNAGATNTFRVLGKKAGMIVMFVDLLKGWVASSLAVVLVIANAISFDDLLLYKLLLGIAAVTGHIFPVFAQFRGGKGVATLLGMILSIHIEAALICVGIFILVFSLSKYVSLGSMIAALAFPVLLLLPKFNPHEPVVVIFAFALFAIVVLTHQKNIKRLIKGEESKLYLRRRIKS